MTFGRTDQGVSHLLDGPVIPENETVVGAELLLAICGRGGTGEDGRWQDVWLGEIDAYHPECRNCHRRQYLWQDDA
jgi:hypothetical protein